MKTAKALRDTIEERKGFLIQEISWGFRVMRFSDVIAAFSSIEHARAFIDNVLGGEQWK